MTETGEDSRRECREIIIKYDYDIYVLCETWLKNQDEIIIPCYLLQVYLYISDGPNIIIGDFNARIGKNQDFNENIDYTRPRNGYEQTFRNGLSQR